MPNCRAPCSGSRHPSPQPLAAATTNHPREPEAVMSDFLDFVHGFDRPRVFVAAPLAFDGLWIDHYLRQFTSFGLLQGPYEPDGVFDHSLCLRSY